MKTSPCYQRTLATSITTVGVGLHSGQEVRLTLSPAPIGAGIVFVRTDLDNAPIPMAANLVQDTVMSSNLISGSARVGTVEHLLSAVAAYGLDNLYIQVDAPEIPIMDGSAAPFLALIEQAGVTEQSAPKHFIKITKSVRVQEGDKWARFDPYNEGFLMEFEIFFDHPAIQATPQVAILQFGTESFANDISHARTFGFLKDLQVLREKNLALGGSLQNAIVLDEASIVNPEGLRYPNEFARHKLLDAVGDLYVIGHPLLAKFSAYKSGHALNNQLIRAVLADPTTFEIVTFYDKLNCPIGYDLPKNSLKVS